MGAALGWGALAASSVVIGALLGCARDWPSKPIGQLLGFGAGALISAISFELFGEGLQNAGGDGVSAGLAAGALTYFVLNRRLERRGGPGGRLGARARRVPRRRPRAARARA